MKKVLDFLKIAAIMIIRNQPQGNAKQAARQAKKIQEILKKVLDKQSAMWYNSKCQEDRDKQTASSLE